MTALSSEFRRLRRVRSLKYLLPLLCDFSYEGSISAAALHVAAFQPERNHFHLVASCFVHFHPGLDVCEDVLSSLLDSLFPVKRGANVSFEE